MDLHQCLDLKIFDAKYKEIGAIQCVSKLTTFFIGVYTNKKFELMKPWVQFFVGETWF